MYIFPLVQFYHNPVALNGGQDYYPGNIWQYLETLMVVTNGGREGTATGIYWVRDRDTAEHLTMHRTAPNTKNYWSQMSIVRRVRNPTVTPQNKP